MIIESNIQIKIFNLLNLFGSLGSRSIAGDDRLMLSHLNAIKLDKFFGSKRFANRFANSAEAPGESLTSLLASKRRSNGKLRSAKRRTYKTAWFTAKNISNGSKSSVDIQNKFNELDRLGCSFGSDRLEVRPKFALGKEVSEGGPKAH